MSKTETLFPVIAKIQERGFRLVVENPSRTLYNNKCNVIQSRREKEDKGLKENSYMIAIPKQREDLVDVEVIINRLNNSEELEVLSLELEKCIKLQFKMNGEEYSANVGPFEYELNQMLRVQHFFSDLDIETVQKSDLGLLTEMEFGDDALESYHVQLKLLHILLPDAVAVLDDSSEKLLSGEWVKLAAESYVPPAPRYIYTVQAVSGEDGEVWLHTHGLNRCGITELEILGSDTENYNSHYNIIETMAGRMLELDEELEDGEPLYLAMVTEDIPLFVTPVNWEEALDYYPDEILGGKDDREEGHNGNTSAIFCYLSPDDLENREYGNIRAFDEFLEDNPLYMLSESETQRMSSLARERIDYMIKATEDKNNNILVKIGLEVDEEYAEEVGKEHIWFEVESIEDGKINGILTQEPYYIAGLHKDAKGTYSFNEVTDWIIFTENDRITPDTVYLMNL